MRISLVVLTVGAAFMPSGGASGSRDSGGTQLWASRYNGPGNEEDGAEFVAVSLDGSKVFVAGYSCSGPSTGAASTRGHGCPFGASDLDYATVAYDAATGAVEWGRRYNGRENEYDAARAVALSPDGAKLFVTGESKGINHIEDYATVSYQAETGRGLWVKRYNGPGDDFDSAFSIAGSPDGSKVFVTGYSYASFEDSSSSDYATIAYDAATGDVVWGRRYNGPGDDYDAAFSVAASPDGSKVFVAGNSFGPTTSSDYATIAYDAQTGAVVWGRRYNGPGGDYDAAHSVAVSPDGSKLFVTGYSYGPTGNSDYATIAYEATTGAALWVARYNGPGNSQDSVWIHSVAVSPDGSRVFVTGSSDGMTSRDYATVAYDAAMGDELWVARYDGPGNDDDSALSVAVSPDGAKVFVTGDSPGIKSFRDFATAAYDAATGDELWVARYDGPGHYFDSAASVAVSPDGTQVFVTGYSHGVTTNTDWVTVAYEA